MANPEYDESENWTESDWRDYARELRGDVKEGRPAYRFREQPIETYPVLPGEEAFLPPEESEGPGRTYVTAPRHDPSRFLEEAIEPWTSFQQSLKEPTWVEKKFGTSLPARAASGLWRGARAVAALPLTALNIPYTAIEMATEQAPRAIGEKPVSTPISRVAPDVAGVVAGGASGIPKWLAMAMGDLPFPVKTPKATAKIGGKEAVETIKDDVVAGLESWAKTQPKGPASDDIAKGLKAWRATQNDEILEKLLEKARQAKIEADRLKAERKPPQDVPGPRSTLPRVKMLPAGEPEAVLRSMVDERRGLTPVERAELRRAQEPTRVIEAPPVPEEQAARLRERLARGEDVNIRELLHQPTANVVMEPGFRDIETGRMATAARPRQPGRGGPPPTREVTGVINEPINLPKDVSLGPSRSERMASRGWTREVPDTLDEPTYVLRDDKGVTHAELVEVDVPDVGGKYTPNVWRARRPDGFEIGVFSNLDDAETAVRQLMPDVKRTPRQYPPIAGGSDMPDFKPRVARAAPPREGPSVPGSVPGREPLPPPDSRPPVPTIDPPIEGARPVPSPDPMEPYAVLNRVAQRYQAGHYGQKFREGSAQLKSVLRISTPTEIAKAYPAYGDLVWATKQARREIEEKANNLVSAKDRAITAIGEDEFSRLMRLRDENKALDTTPEIGKMIDEIYDTIQDYSGELPTNPTLKSGFMQRLKQTQELRGVKAVDVDEYVTEDVNRIVPGARDAKLRTKLEAGLKGDEAYTVENIDRMIRASARASVMGTKMKAGYMQAIKPHLAKLANAPDIIKNEVDDYVNYFIGARGSRSPHTLQRWSDRLRATQFASKIAGNLTSPVWNAGQNLLTFAETDAKSFSKAWGDVLKHWSAKATGGVPDEHFTNLARRLGIDNELAQASTMSDIGTVPTELMGKFDKGLGKFNDIFGMPFRFVEANNRTVAALSGYYDGIARGMTDAEAIEHGKKIMDKTQFTGGEADLPRAFRKATGGAAGQFKTFTVKYGEYMWNNATDAIKAANPAMDMTPQQRKDAIRKFVKFWGSQTAVGGVGSVPFIGEALQEQLEGAPLDVHKGLGGMIGLDLTRQFGASQLPLKIGKRPVEMLKDLMYSLPGPTFNAAQDIIALKRGKYSGDGLEINLSELNRDLTWDEWERKLVRQLPAGVQMARIIEGMKIRLSSGKEGGPYSGTGPRKEAMSWAEATGFEKPSGALQSEVMQNALMTAVGLRGTDVERESQIRSEEAEHTSIENEAKYNAAKYYAAGKRIQGDMILRKAERQLGMKPNTLRPSAQSLKNARKRQNETALERKRKQAAKKGRVIPTP